MSARSNCDGLLIRMAQANGNTLFKKKVISDGSIHRLYIYAQGESKLAVFADSMHKHLFPRGAIIYVSVSVNPLRPFIHSFYSLVSMMPELRVLLTPDDANMLKGLARESLCYLLRKTVGSDSDLVLKLEASGSIPGTSMLGLVQYYQDLGFVPSNKRVALKKQIEQKGVPMEAKISDVFEKCKSVLCLKRVKRMPYK